LIEWIKYTRSKRIPLKFKNIPEQLLTLAKLSGFDKSSHFVIHTDLTETG
jgi:phospholipid transport system transporter-binding protein